MFSSWGDAKRYYAETVPNANKAISTLRDEIGALYKKISPQTAASAYHDGIETLLKNIKGVKVSLKTVSPKGIPSIAGWIGAHPWKTGLGVTGLATTIGGLALANEYGLFNQQTVPPPVIPTDNISDLGQFMLAGGIIGGASGIALGDRLVNDTSPVTSRLIAAGLGTLLGMATGATIGQTVKGLN